MAVNFELDDLQAFRAVAEMKSFSKAAEAVHISQPAFSRRIEKLESALGVRLLDRNTRRVTLTAVGRDFARKVEVLRIVAPGDVQIQPVAKRVRVHIVSR